MEDKKNLEVVSGDGTDLNISRVYSHLNESVPKSSKKKPENIVVPKELKPKKEQNNDEEKEGVKFSELPDDWTCPLCGVGKELFEEVKE